MSSTSRAPPNVGWSRQLAGVAEGGYAASDAGYFKTMGIPLLAGREFTARDTADAPNVRSLTIDRRLDAGFRL